MPRKCWLPALLCLCLLLGGCAPTEPRTGGPNLALLDMPPYDEPAPTGSAASDSGALRVDLWLGASRLMGGIDATDSALYPHFGRRYREGGFHYRYDGEVGWYENVLRDMLATAEGSRTRILRFGDERIPDGRIVSAGLAAAGDAEALRSARRDLLTYAVDPMPTVFAGFSAENMEGSYYALGTAALNRVAALAEDGGAALENPGRLEEMGALLDEQIAAFASGEPGDWTATGGDTDWPLLYALQNIDLSRLSVLTFDPAEMRRLAGTDRDGEALAYAREALEARGVFDSGLSVGLYAFRLDYMGQMASFASADFAEPLIWGKLKYNDKKRTSTDALPMPRVLLALVVGQPARVDDFTSRLNARMDADPALKGLRGPADGELTYVADGRTVTQQPFTFAYDYTAFARPRFDCLTQHTAGMTVAAEGGETARDGSLATVRLPQGASGCEITLSFPLARAEEGAALDLTGLQNARVTVTSMLTLDEVAPNQPGAQALAGEDAQTIAARDKLYVFRLRDDPFADAPHESPFTLASIAPSADGGTLAATVAIGAEGLAPGYYRLLVEADASEGQLAWPHVGWIDGADSLDATLTNEQIAAWEAFAALIRRYDGDSAGIPRQFQHAWGPLSERSYHGVAYPDFPPVYKAPGLRQLAAQLRAAAVVDSVPCVRCVFDVFVGEDPQE